MAALDAGAAWLEPNEVGSSQHVCRMFSAIYWPASVSNWCDSCSLLGERRHDIPSPRFISGPGGHYRPLLHEVFTTSMFACIAYYRQMSSWFVWQTARTILSYSSRRSFASLLMLIPALLALYWPRVVMSWVYLQGELGRFATGHGGMLHAIITTYHTCVDMRLVGYMPR